MATRKKRKTAYFCTECGNESPKWEGQCPACREWNTLAEAPVQDSRNVRGRGPGGLAGMSGALAAGQNRPVVLETLPEGGTTERIPTGIAEFDFVLGGGIVPGSIVLLGGPPGVGKSTILTQLAANLKALSNDALYVSGEESDQQVKLRAQRIGPEATRITFLAETDVDSVLHHAREMEPRVLIVDSIQTLYSQNVDGAPGNISQVKECAARLQQFAKAEGTAVFLIGHVTKSGNIAGPQVLEHIVDTVVYFEHADDFHRLLRVYKNRFGSVDEIGVFRMTESGLETVDNPSELFLADRSAGSSGSTVAALMEGSRPLLLELQGLVSMASYGSPQRVATGFDRKRLAILLAVLEKRAGIPFSQYDVFVNVVGGIRLNETAADAAVAAAVVSSAFDKPIPADMMFLGELGLGGELRRVSRVERRLAEAAKLGFKTVVLARRSVPPSIPAGLRVIGVDTVVEMIEKSMGPVLDALKTSKKKEKAEPSKSAPGKNGSSRVEVDL